jgi:hypothetical protein
MKRYLFLLIVWLLGLWPSFAQPGPERYYVVDGQRIVLQSHPADWALVLPDGIAADRLIADATLRFPAAAKGLQSVPGEGRQLVFRSQGISVSQRQLLETWLKNRAPGAVQQPLVVDARGFSYLVGSRVYAKVKPGISASRLQAWLQQQSAKAEETYPYDITIRFYRSLDAGKDAISLANRMMNSQLFVFAEPDLAGFDLVQTPPNDPLYPLQWGLLNNGSSAQFNGTPGADVDADLAWSITRGSPSIRIAVLDVGVQRNHPDLAANIDPLGFGLLAPVATTGDVLDTAACHGTACAGIIGAVANNGIGVAGIAPECKLIPVNIARNTAGLFGTFSQIAGAIDWAWSTAAADVLSNSWGGGSPSTLYRDAIRRAVTNGRGGRGAIVVFSAGNANAGIFSPASFTDCIAVGAMNMCFQRKSPTSCDGETFWGSNFGFGLDVVAPGVKIATTWNTGLTTLVNYNPAFNGTSAAAPFVSATAALMLSVNPLLTQTALRELLERSVRKVGSYTYAPESTQPNGTWNAEMGYGLINTYQAVLAAQSPSSYCPVSIRAAGATQLCSGQSTSIIIQNPVAGAQYQWRRDGQLIQAGTSVTVSQAGNYDATILTSGGCRDTSASVTISLGVSEGALLVDAGRDTTVCQNSRVYFGGAPSARGGTPFVQAQRGLAYSVSENAFYRFNPTRPNEFRMIKSSFLPGGNSNTLIAGAAVTPQGLYMLARVTNQLIRVDTATGNFTVVGACSPLAGTDWSGMTYHPTQRKLYATAFGTNTDFYEIDMNTGAATWLGAVPGSIPLNLIWLAADTHGDVLTMSLGVGVPAQVYRVQFNPIQLTPFANTLPFEANFAQDAALDSISQRFYLFGNTRVGGSSDFYNGQGIWELNRSNGNVQLMGSLAQSFNQFDGLAFAGKEYRYQWSPSTGLDNPQAPNPVFTAPNPGTFTYTLTVTDLCGNVSTDQVVVTVNPLPAAPTISPASPALSHRNGFSETLSFTADPSLQYRWQLNGTNTSNITSSQIVNSLNPATDRFAVQITNPLTGCVRTSPAIQPTYITGVTLGATPVSVVCDTAFYDAGGSAGNTTSTAFVQTFQPAATDRKVQWSIYRLQLSSGATLRVFDGSSISAPLLATLTSAQNGTSLIRHTASNTAGSLTIQFTPGSSTSAGWFSGLTCEQSLVYRTRMSGTWTNAAIWESKPLGEVNYSAASRPPVKGDDSILIRHGVTVQQALPIDQVRIESGGTLSVLSGGSMQLDKQVAMPEIFVARGGQLNIASGRQVGGSQSIVEVCGGLDVSGFLNASETRFIDTEPQVITANGDVGSIAHLRVQNPAGIFMQGDLSVSLLTLVEGVVSTGGIQGVLIDQVLGGNDASYVQGPVRIRLQAGAGEKMFPLGVGGRFVPVWISAATGSGTQTAELLAMMFAGSPASRSLPASLGGVLENRFLQVSLVSGAGQLSGYRMRYTYSPDDGVFFPSGLRLARAGDFDATWTNLGGMGSAPVSGTITSNLFSALGDFVLAWATGNPIPVRLLRWEGRSEVSGNRLEWEVADELLFAGYRIEASSDGQRYDSIGWVPARGVQRGVYLWLDRSPRAMASAVFYRLKLVDQDGRERSSAVIRLARSVAHIQAYPNPVVHGRLFIRYRSQSSGDASLRLMDAQGRLVWQERKPVMVGEQIWSINMEQLPAGGYSLHVLDINGRWQQRIIRSRN